jgi:DNA-binding NarL/FixJ family response regulator
MASSARSSRDGDVRSTGWLRARGLGLSCREIEVLELLGEGSSDRQVASRLCISPKTAGHHVSHILAKLDLSRRGEAAAVAFRIGLIRGADPAPRPGMTRRRPWRRRAANAWRPSDRQPV